MSRRAAAALIERSPVGGRCRVCWVCRAGRGTDVQSRIRAGLLEGPARDTECRPVRERLAREASYNCFTLSDRRDFRAQVLPSSKAELSVGYRFSGRADLAAARLFWCKENPPPLHPTSIVVKVPLSTRCR